jgi:hypothetical protein
MPLAFRAWLIALVVTGFRPLSAQTPAVLDSLLAPHRWAMSSLAGLDGVWRGEGSTLSASGDRTTFTQTIRVGSLGDGALKLLEGHSFGPDGRAYGYNVEIISYKPSTRVYSLRLYAQGNTGDVPIVPQPGGFTLEYSDGPATVRFTITVTKDAWNEVAERRAPGQTPVRFLELNLRRLSDTDWPAAGAVRPD